MDLLLTFLVQLITPPKPYTHFFNSQALFVSASLGGIKTFQLISSPFKKSVLVSIAFNFHFFCAMDASIIIKASLEQVGGSFNISSLYISSKPVATSPALATTLLSMLLKEQAYFSGIEFFLYMVLLCRHYFVPSLIVQFV